MLLAAKQLLLHMYAAFGANVHAHLLAKAEQLHWLQLATSLHLSNALFLCTPYTVIMKLIFFALSPLLLLTAVWQGLGPLFDSISGKP
jgi:hypothetical protein